MKQTNFISSLIHHHHHLTTLVFFFFFFFFFFLPETCQSIDDQQYLDCGVPQTCGDGGQNISYPFYIKDQHKQHCGFPRFDLSCNSNNQPILNLSNNSYVVHNIFYENQSIRISNAEFLSNETDSSSNCFPISIRNLTLYGNRFDFALNNTNLFVWSNCSSNLTEHEVGSCSDEDGDGGKLTMILENEANFGNVSRNCRNGVEVPVELDDEIGEDWEYYERLLRRGFLLNWTATNCSVCQQSGGRCGFDYNDYRFMCFCPDRPHALKCKPRDRRRALKLGLGIGIGGSSILVIALVIFVILWRRYKRNKYASSEYLSRNTSSDPSSKSYQDRGNVYFGVPIFSYCELEGATHNFDPNKELGDGGFGTVYHGILRDGREVAVKRLYENNYKRVDQFRNEIEILTRLRHKNLVILYGCTSRHSRELLLVYEYIPNGTVADHLHGDRAKPGSVRWPIRMSIAIETASALAYLHATDIIHRDVKTNNILLDNNFSVKVADFGLSRLFPTDVTHVSTAPQGTPGYVDPEYHQCYQLTDKSDVYSFGVVLVELLSSLPAVDISRHRHEINLSNLAINRIQKCAYDELIDSSLGFDSDPTVKRMTTSVAELAFQCLQNDKEMRPTMEEVLETLKGIESGRDNEMEGVEEEVDAIRPLPFSPESDEIVLLSKMRPPPSPISVTEKWGSLSSTPTTSV